MKEWLAKNKHVKTVTRDRASAYASATQEILPDAIQVADRFHLHQNLLEVIKNTVNSIVPVDIKIPCDVDNFAEYNEKSVQLYHAIHKYNDAGYSKSVTDFMSCH